MHSIGTPPLYILVVFYRYYYVYTYCNIVCDLCPICGFAGKGGVRESKRIDHVVVDRNNDDLSSNNSAPSSRPAQLNTVLVIFFSFFRTDRAVQLW